MKFTELEIHPDLIRAAADAGYAELTPIQEKCLFPALEGRDIAGISQTGTGKTVAFLLPVLHFILQEKWEGPAALILTPTRELCLQITEEAKKLTRHSPIGITAIYGGEGYSRQEDELSKNPHLIVATPGRLIDYIKQKKVPLDRLHYLILDEADRMFDMGFIRDIRYILKSVPDDSRTMVFSATLSFNVLKVAGEFMKDPVEVEIQSESIAVDRIAQNLLHLSRSEKMPYLVNSLLAMENPRAIVFTNTKYTVQKIVDHCHRYGIAATGISSLLDQKKRIRLLKDFKEGKYTVLVATDVASRGLDIDDIAHVFNFDLPQDAESYVHRIGRTARAGKDGISVSFCSEDDYDFLPRIQRYLDTKIPVAEINSAFVAYPSGNFSAYVDEHQPKHEKPKAGAVAGTGGARRNNRNRNTRRPKDGTEKRSPSNADEAAPLHTERKQTHGGSDAASIRESDRAAILSGVNTKAGGGGVLTEDKNYRPAEQKPNRRRKNKNRNNPRKPGQEEETGRPSKNNYRDRDSDQKGSSDRRSSDSRGEPRSQHPRGEPRDTRGQKRTTSKSGRITTISRTPAKQGIISKILGFFGK